ncbi:3-hydroxyacyl-CoA dehydrogenase [Reticulomyxa filosa]|uniref:3-hydroxyacyl-CoA dehydrogenase n=1 Tax=Reticulomyxa filosa TaxID=46433 RepID=X6NDV8_RETFI|nr:3-hydroxyacyl-CoA dehydrogenase [Reticulomyxa filosa]|eukprot:ETO24078.1 3-hydroxyacyl-CoA dehydrogenase [Reticulomyxa filosa]
MKLEGKTFFITGGVSGLGLAAAKSILSKGGNVIVSKKKKKKKKHEVYQLFLADIQKDKGDKVAEELGSKAIFVKTDVSCEKSVTEAIKVSVEKFGSIHGCINCAGIGYPQRTLSKSGKEHPLVPFERVLKINLIGTFNVLRLCAKAMLNNKPDADGERGVIINTASVAAFDGQIGQAAYSASKGGVVGMTLPIARDLSEFGIRVCTIAPGIFGLLQKGKRGKKGKKKC